MNSLLLCNIDLNATAACITALVAIITMIRGLCEYENYKRKNQIQYLLEFGKKYTEDENLKEVVTFLECLEDDNMYKQDCMDENNTYNEKAIKIHSIEMFMRFIEELELLIRGNAISESAALNLFGHYTTILDKYNKRWPKLGYDEKYWKVYRDFVEKAKKFNYNSVTL